MGKLIPSSADPLLKINDVAKRGSHWLRKWDPYLDRLEEFASNIGVDSTQRVANYARRWDRGLLAMGGALIALIALALGQ